MSALFIACRHSLSDSSNALVVSPAGLSGGIYAFGEPRHQLEMYLILLIRLSHDEAGLSVGYDNVILTGDMKWQVRDRMQLRTPCRAKLEGL